MLAQNSAENARVWLAGLDLIWFGGMSMWFIGNSVYTFGLSYAPLALLTSLFGTKF